MKAISARGMIPKAFGTSVVTERLGAMVKLVAVNGGRENSHTFTAL